jgi:urease accessory protein
MKAQFLKTVNGQAITLCSSRDRFGVANKLLNAVLLLGFSSAALAHPGHSEGFLSAFAHPFSGLDHLLMMLFVGVWAGRSGGLMRWLLPATFLVSMLGGWLLGQLGAHIAGLESGIAATLIVLGVLLVLQIQLPRLAQMGLVAGFAVLHGLAHGGELGSAWQGAAGMLLATALLHGIGLAATLLIPQQRVGIYRLAGALLAAMGGVLLAAI